jgi:mono/diheme cytochrome c family protein
MLAVLVAGAVSREAYAQQPSADLAATKDLPASPFVQPFLAQHCLDCHNSDDKKGELALDRVNPDDVGRHSEVWEKVVRKLTARHMPPAEMPRPAEREYNQVVSWLESALDAAAARRPDPGRTPSLRRLNRTEYQNAIRDLLALQVDATQLLPADESSHGFDNITVSDLSPTLLNRYISAAQEISRRAVGRASQSPGGDTFRVRPDVTQDDHIAGLPLGTRGGVLIPYHFPQSGEYEVQVRLMRDRNEGIEGLREPHELEVQLDRERVALFTVKPAGKGSGDWPAEQGADGHLNARIKATAGPHNVGVAFLKKPSSLLETTRQPLNVHFNFYRHPRIGPAVYQVSILGPFDAAGQATAAVETPSRQRLFVCTPSQPHEEEECAKRILAALMRRAYRRPVTDSDLQKPLALYRQAREGGDFEAGIEMATSAVLVNPHFLFRIERDPAGIAPGAAYPISDLELASRLSFFLWSSIPDDELLDLAIADKLSQPEVLPRQVRRMLVDARSRALVSNFASQWLHLRNLEAATPDQRLYPDFDDNLRQAFRQETELHFEAMLREDRSVLDLLKADYTFLNERLARHYGIPHVMGSRFRRVALEEESVRGGLLRQGSIHTVTSYATRTSPVIRGKWILENLLGMPPPPPPANVPALKDNTVSSTLSVRQRLAEHRANAACASCHQLMDPAGFSLENFDAVGRWRTVEEGLPIDATGGLPDGSQFVGVSGLEKALLDRPELFVRTLVEKLLTYALGRGVEPVDAPAIRKIVRDARAEDYRFSSLVVGIATSVPFTMRRSE